MCRNESILSEDKKKGQFFFVVVDQVISSVTSGVSQLMEWHNLFGFLYNTKQFKQCIDENKLHIRCKKYEEIMGDIDAPELEMELRHFIAVVSREKNSCYC